MRSETVLAMVGVETDQMVRQWYAMVVVCPHRSVVTILYTLESQAVVLRCQWQAHTGHAINQAQLHSYT